MITAFIKKSTKHPTCKGYAVIIKFNNGVLSLYSYPDKYSYAKQCLITARLEIDRNNLHSVYFDQFTSTGRYWSTYF